MQLKISIFFEDFPLILSQHYAALVRDYVKVERAKSWPSNLKLELEQHWTVRQYETYMEQSIIKQTWINMGQMVSESYMPNGFT